MDSSPDSPNVNKTSVNKIDKKRWLWLIAATALIVAGGAYLAVFRFERDPCSTQKPEVLAKRYPELMKLRDKQEAEIEKLLEMHRQQDVIINLKMGNDEISPEQALRFSLDQVDQVAELRKRQHDEFDKMCRQAVSG